MSAPTGPSSASHAADRQALTRDPLREADRPHREPLEDFLSNAVLLYGPPDGPDRSQYAHEMLAAHPGLPAQSIHAAAAVADPVQVARHLAVDPGAANREGGPFGWPPLLYLTYSRVRPDAPVEETVATARLLISAGADPNAGYLWQAAPPPFTALTGVFGNGEQRSDRQPPHQHAGVLARVEGVSLDPLCASCPAGVRGGRPRALS